MMFSSQVCDAPYSRVFDTPQRAPISWRIREGRLVADSDRNEELGPSTSPLLEPCVVSAHACPATLDVGRSEDVADETLALLEMKAAVVSDDPCGVLAAVLDASKPS